MKHTMEQLESLVDRWGFDPPEKIPSTLHHPGYVWKLRQRSFSVGRGGAKYSMAEYVLTKRRSSPKKLIDAIAVMNYQMKCTETELDWDTVLKHTVNNSYYVKLQDTGDENGVWFAPHRKIEDPTHTIKTPEALAHYVETMLLFGEN